MNYLSRKKRVAVLACLVNGISGRKTSRIVGVSKTTVFKLLADANEIAGEYRDGSEGLAGEAEALGKDRFFVDDTDHTNLDFFYRNYCRISGPSRETNAMAVGAASGRLSLVDLVDVLEFVEQGNEEETGPRRTRPRPVQPLPR